MASSSSMPPPPLVKDEEPRNWSELPPELTSSIMLRLGAFEILENAQKVCRAWRGVSKDPSMWRKIDMGNLKFHKLNGYEWDRMDRHLDRMCRHAVDRSEGGLVEIYIGNFGTCSLLDYIAYRSSNLRSLGLETSYPLMNNELVKEVAKLPLLEVLELSKTWKNLDLKAVGHSCPKLKTLKLNCSSYPGSRYDSDDEDALSIAESMPQLHHLQLIGNSLSDTGLNAILDHCPHLEHLDLRMCMNINLSGDLEKRCVEMAKDLRRPNDSTADYPYQAAFVDTASDDDSDYYIDDSEDSVDDYVFRWR